MDGLGRTVSIRQPARRIVSLAPATTELLFALGAGPRVVGRTRWCDFPAEALSVKSVGDGLNPNVEAVAATAPDLVVMYATAANATAIEQLTRLGIAVVNVANAAESDQPLTRVGVCPGSGASLVQMAKQEGCQVFVTGEMKHHEMLEALHSGLSLILAGHTNTERGYLPRLARRLTEALPGVQVQVNYGGTGALAATLLEEGDVVVIADPGDAITYLNPGARRLLEPTGEPPELSVGEPGQQCAKDEERQRVRGRS